MLCRGFSTDKESARWWAFEPGAAWLELAATRNMDGRWRHVLLLAVAGLKGSWEVENHGIAPDVEVWQDPKLVREGH